MSPTSKMTYEDLRLRELLELEILDTEAEADFDTIVTLASKISGCPVSLISLVDKDRQWFKAKVGTDVPSTPRDISFCTHAIQKNEPFIINDAREDQRFSQNPLVVNDPNIRFYAGLPLTTSAGYNIGTLCTIDRVPRQLTSDQIEQLQLLAQQTVRMMELRLANRKMQALQEHSEQMKQATSRANTKALREREKYQDVLEQATIPFALLEGPEHRFAFVNSCYLETFGLTEDILGKPVAESLPDAQTKGFVALLDNVFTTGITFSAEEALYQRVLPDGTTREMYLDFTYAAKRDAANNIEGVLAIIVDVTEKVRARKSLEKNQEVLRQVFDSMPQMSFEADPTGAITAFNKRWYDYIGATPGTEGWGWKDKPIHHPDDIDRTIQTWQHSVNTGKPYEIEYRLRRADGEYRWHLGRGVPIKNSDGEILHWFGTNTDIHDQKVAAELIKNNERVLSLTTNALPALVSYLDTDFRYKFVNSAYEKWFNRPTSDFINRTVREIVGDDMYERVGERFERALRGESLEFEEEAHYPQGTRHIHAAYTPDIDESGKVRGVVTLVKDVSDRKKIEDELRHAKDLAEAANQAKSAFLANMSHEIRTPIGAIMGFSDLARQHDANKKDIFNYLSIIERNSVQVLRIIDDILDLAKVEAGRMDVEILDFNLAEFLADFSSLMGFRARENGIVFNLIAATELPETISSDPTRLRQILTNSVGNAIKFTSNGSVTLDVSWRKNTLTFEITDTGRGISKEQSGKLFQAFVQADVSTTRKFGGTGLGLVLTKRLCQLLGGDYILEQSEIGVGSKFVATICPVIPQKAKIIPKEHVEFRSADESRSNAEPGRLDGIRVLVVEDSRDNQILVRLFLEKQGAHISMAHDGAEGVEKALSENFDVVLMDIQMPVMDGYEAVRKLRTHNYQKPVVAFTAHAMKEESERARQAGFTHFLSKPIQKNALIDMVLEAVKHH